MSVAIRARKAIQSSVVVGLDNPSHHRLRHRFRKFHREGACIAERAPSADRSIGTCHEEGDEAAAMWTNVLKYDRLTRLKFEPTSIRRKGRDLVIGKSASTHVSVPDTYHRHNLSCSVLPHTMTILSLG